MLIEINVIILIVMSMMLIDVRKITFSVIKDFSFNNDASALLICSFDNSFIRVIQGGMLLIDRLYVSFFMHLADVNFPAAYFCSILRKKTVETDTGQTYYMAKKKENETLF